MGRRALAVLLLAPLLAGVTQSGLGQVPVPVPAGNPLQEYCSLVVTHDCGTISGPSPDYPDLDMPIDANCSVSFRIEDDGTVSVLSARYDDARFLKSAVQGMATVRFKTRDVCNRVCSNVGRVMDWPLQYRFQ